MLSFFVLSTPTTEVDKQIIGMIADYLQIIRDKISNTSEFEELGATNIDISSIIMLIEEKYHFQIHDKDALSIHTVGDLIHIVHRSLNKFSDISQ